MSALGSGQLISQFCHFPEASRHKEENVLSHNKLSGSGELERLRLTNHIQAHADARNLGLES